MDKRSGSNALAQRTFLFSNRPIPGQYIIGLGQIGPNVPSQCDIRRDCRSLLHDRSIQNEGVSDASVISVGVPRQRFYAKHSQDNGMAVTATNKH